MNAAHLARLRQIETALAHERAAQRQREQATAFKLPEDPTELHRLYAEMTAPSGATPPDLVGLTAAEQVEAFRRRVWQWRRWP